MNDKNFTYYENGFVGHMAIPKNNTEYAVIVIMDGEKSLLPGVKIAERFADYGITGLSVSLFGADGIPSSPNRIPLEMIGKAITYLKMLGYSHISLYSMSMGTIFAALGGIHFDEVENIVLVSPTHVPFEGVDSRYKRTGHSVATWNEEDIPFASTDFTKYKPSKYLKFSDAAYPVMGMWQSFYEAYHNADEDKILPLERSHCNILMIAGEEDEDWPSVYSVRKLESRLKEYGYKERVETIIYPHVGHLLGIMPNRQREKWLYRLIPLVGIAYKTFGKYRKHSCNS